MKVLRSAFCSQCASFKAWFEDPYTDWGLLKTPVDCTSAGPCSIWVYQYLAEESDDFRGLLDVLEYLRDRRDSNIISLSQLFHQRNHIEVLFDNDVECQNCAKNSVLHIIVQLMPNTDSPFDCCIISDYSSAWKQKSFDTCTQKKQPWRIHPSEESNQILSETEELQMPGICQKLIEKKAETSKCLIS